ncbi:regulatory helix-turn-helix AraC family protein [Halanaerobium saccharolyticum]|uniref:Regulatory helix-turn-helix AraC family protein n=1 Tax=Halanaerobium saccharolyticum TaxID=43595 RepID=A0A4R6L8A7_9FIRM|nr:helix-turn-helix domain-containing protein [Halanaerobium saccharolyticum]TDO70521.1 regulatory helix-turn-helix AraC family protein [Halanaerobium saccharolyticum]
MEVKLFYSNLLTNIFNSFKTLLQTEKYLEEYEYYYYSILNETALSKIEQLFYDFVKMILDNIKNSNQNHSKVLIDQALNYIESNYDQKISLENVANELNISKNYLCNVFKDEIGENTTTYINKLRVDKAKQLLLEKKL